MDKRYWLLILGGLALTLAGSKSPVNRIAEAIGYAEGWGVGPEARNRRNHNPGNLTLDLTGAAIGKDGAFVVYRTDAEGWAALRRQVELMFSGSAIYKPTMTLYEVAMRYTATQQREWAANVAARLGVTTDTPLSAIRG